MSGETSGIGAALSKALGEARARVEVRGGDAERLDAAKTATGATWTFADDLSYRADRLPLIKAVPAGGRLDLLVNNAGMMLEPNLNRGR